MSKAILVRELGGPEVLRLEDRPTPSPGPGELLVRNEAIGVNYADVYNRIGLYKLSLPFVPGLEGGGVVSAVGEGVSGFKPGDRVGYASGGAYAEETVVPAGKAFVLPNDISTEMAATLVTKGGTAHYLLFETWAVKPGEAILVHAAAGGVGSILVQWGKAIGARVIALAGSDEKVAAAKQLGAAAAFNSREDGWVAKVREATGGKGVDVVYDGVGQATFERSLDCLRPRGLMVSYGNASGPVTGVSLSMLQSRGSLYVTRPTSAQYFGTPDTLKSTMAAVFDAVRTGKFVSTINQRFPLAQAADAHRALEGRETTGATVLIP